jgi:hypothetical protein
MLKMVHIKFHYKKSEILEKSQIIIIEQVASNKSSLLLKIQKVKHTNITAIYRVN